MTFLKKHSTSIFATVLLSTLFACGQKAASKEAVEKTAAVSSETLRLESFTEFPPEIDGCSCYFSKDADEFDQNQYIYANDYMETSFLKINGEMVKFTETETIDIDEKTSILKAKSENYTLELEIKEQGQNGDETWLKTGTIKLTDKNGKTISQYFHGECGC